MGFNSAFKGLSQFLPGKITEDERITVLLGCVKM
jgi:hypothetical protein